MIYERKNTALRKKDRKELQDQEMDQVTQIKVLLQKRGDPMAFFEVMDVLGFNHDSTKRALSDLTKKHNDRNGRPFAIYQKDVRKKNPNGKTCGTYQYNPAYGKSTKPGENLSMFDAEGCSV